jgi:CHC2 zinc finger
MKEQSNVNVKLSRAFQRAQAENVNLFDWVQACLPILDFCQRFTSIELFPSGDRYKGRCPLHSETHGFAFVVDPKTGHWKCFGKCDASGNVVELAWRLWGKAQGKNRHQVARELAGMIEQETGKKFPGDISTGKRGSCETVLPKPSPVIEAAPKLAADHSEQENVWREWKGYSVEEMAGESPYRLPEPRDQEEIGNIAGPMICREAGELYAVSYDVRRAIIGTPEQLRLRERGSNLQYLCPDILRDRREGIKKANAKRRLFVIAEFDFPVEAGETAKEKAWRFDKQAILHKHLSGILPLVVITYSGGKSLHGLYSVKGKEEPEIQAFIQKAIRLGACWRTCLIRLGGKIRQ